MPADLDWSVEVASDEAAWDALESEWRALWAISPTAGPTSRFEWARLWWQVYGAAYGAGPRAPQIVCVRRRRQLVGLLPLYVERRQGLLGRTQLRFLSSGERCFEETCADRLNLLYHPDCGPQAAHWAAHWLAGAEAAPLLELRAMPDGLLLNAVRAALGSAPWTCETRNLGPCWVADLSQGFGPWLDSLSRTTRAKCRKLLRQFDGQGSSFEFEIAADRAGLAAIYRDLMALHQARWRAAGRRGCFGARRFAGFHRLLCAELAPRDEVILARLSHAGRPLAVIYGFRAGQRVECYQTGVDFSVPETCLSPGVLAFVLLFGALAAEGVTQVDLLLGSGGLKDRLCRAGEELWTLTAARDSQPRLSNWLGSLARAPQPAERSA
jgi:CelD/BcsL family acetyltransferase involved in cellulose biosynthesis